MYDCYNKIVGLSNINCECEAANRPVDYNVSKSGLFLSGLANVSRLVSLAKCDKTVWGILQKAISDATIKFVADTNALLGTKFKLKRQPAPKQFLGQAKSRSVFNPSKNYGVITVSCSPIRGGYMILEKIGGVFTGNGLVSVELRNNLEETLGTYEINTVANKYTTTTVNLELPLHSKYLEPLEYYLVYQFDENNLPKDTKLTCGCGGWSPNYNTNSPYYKNIGKHRKAPWADFVMVGGREINSLTELEDDVTLMSNNMYGLGLEVSLACNVTSVICDEALDFKGNALALSMALAIQYGAGIEVANAILRSPVLSWENMVAREDWEDDIVEWSAKYAEKVNYIAKEANRTGNDCLTCKDIVGLTSVGLLA